MGSWHNIYTKVGGVEPLHISNQIVLDILNQIVKPLNISNSGNKILKIVIWGDIRFE